ncbi:MAG TPA: M6 family metalloprotease domain-containing protein, partial [Longimicrobium sp.]|uniref:M6 family metalloprotease domain-containing protein n=1 Tax=Longimicrobium sp. TaxID=2029185 RepID=UPI002EDB0B04
MKVPVASLRRIRAGLVAAALLSAPALHAQDVLRQGRAHGVEAPAWITETLREQPGAFEFRRAWRNKVEGVRQERRRLEGARTGPLMSTGQMQAYGAAVTGTLRVPVIAARYSDRAAPYPAADYQARLFGDGAAGAYTAKSFYREMSRGAFTLDGTVSGWVALPQQAAFYEPSASTSARYGRTFEFLRDALAGADPTVNFGQFDNDGPDGVPNSGDDDGYVDAAAFLYPAAGANCGGPGIWPHRYVYSAYNGGVPFSTDDASARGGTIKVDDYLIQGGLECDGASLMDIGTFAHEMGHALALPDLYDTRGTTSGLGEWDLMASGNYRTPASPAHMSAWSKDFLGWVNVETVFGSYPAVTLAPVYEGGRVLRYDIPGTREYFLLEHRRAFGSDADIRAPGLLVYHVDEGVVEAARVSNEVNAGAVHGVALVEADGLGHLSGGANRGDAGDVFPGALLQTSFGEGTSPGSRGNGGLPSGFSLSGIQYTADVLTFTMQAGGPANAVASVSVTPAAPGIAVGTTQQLVATLRDAAGALVTGPAVTWSSSSPGIVSVTSRGLAQGLAAGGPVTITATAGGASGTASVTVTAALQAVTLTSGVPVAGISGTVGSDRLFRIAVPEGATSLGVSTSGGTGNANLYVRRGAPPLPADCLSVSGSSTEFCGFLNPAAGDWYILVRTEGSYTGLTLTASVAGTLALGDSASGAIGTGAGGQRFPLVLTAGDVIDVGAFRTGGLSAFTPYVELYAPSGSRVA